jgi:hypothetical protein
MLRYASFAVGLVLLVLWVALVLTLGPFPD